MKPPALLLPAALGVAAVLAATLIAAKPPAAPRKDAPTPSPTPAATGDPAAELALARWLVQADGGPDPILLPLAQVVRAATGKSVLPFDAANPADAAALAKLGAALDGLLPRMNRPDSPAHLAAAAGDATAMAARFEDELRSALGVAPAPAEETAADRSYPAFFLADPAHGRNYYLAATLYPSGGEPAGSALALSPGVAAGRMPADGCCLLVGIEHNGKPGRDIAFLNWEILDLARLQVRFRPVFQAARRDALQPGAVLTDGRKGRD